MFLSPLVYSMSLSDQKSVEDYLINLMPMNWRIHESMTEHTEPQEWQRNCFGKESSTNVCWYIGKSIADTTNDNIFKPRSLLNER